MVGFSQKNQNFINCGRIKEGPTLNEAGGWGEGLETLDSVEILDPSENNVWTPGMFWKSITVKIC